MALSGPGRNMASLRRLSPGRLPPGMVPVAAGLVVLGLASYAFLVVAARSLGPARYAPLSVLWALVFLVGPGVFVPLEQELTRAISALEATGRPSVHLARKAALGGASIVAVLSVAALAASGWLQARLFDRHPLLLGGLLLSLVGYYAEYLVRGALAGRGRFRAYGSILAAEGLLRLGGCLVLAAAGVSEPGLYGVVLGAAPLGAAAIGARGQRLFCARPAVVGATGHPGPRDPKSLVSPGLGRALGWLLAGSLAGQLLVNGAPVAVKILATAAEKATVGRFVAGLVVSRVPAFLVASVQAAALPRLSGMDAAGRHADFRSGLARLLVGVGALGVAGIVGAAIAGPALVQALFGSEFRLGRRDMAFLAGASALYMLAVTLSQALIALCAQARVAVCWASGFVTLVVVVAIGPGLLQRAERGLLAGSAVAFLAMAGAVTPLLRERARRPARVTPETGCLPPAVA